MSQDICAKDNEGFSGTLAGSQGFLVTSLGLLTSFHSVCFLMKFSSEIFVKGKGQKFLAS